jgi:hypothetical protein
MISLYVLGMKYPKIIHKVLGAQLGEFSGVFRGNPPWSSPLRWSKVLKNSDKEVKIDDCHLFASKMCIKYETNMRNVSLEVAGAC